MTGAKLQVQ